MKKQITYIYNLGVLENQIRHLKENSLKPSFQCTNKVISRGLTQVKKSQTVTVVGAGRHITLCRGASLFLNRNNLTLKGDGSDSGEVSQIKTL